jgi:hypothetical protein
MGAKTIQKSPRVNNNMNDLYMIERRLYSLPRRIGIMDSRRGHIEKIGNLVG